jgi:HEAT repeat protein
MMRDFIPNAYTFLNLVSILKADLNMALDFLRRERDCDHSPQTLLQRLSFFSDQDFPAFFQELRKGDPANAIRTCVLYLSDKGSDKLSAQIIPSLAATDHYLSAVLDPELLSLESSKRLCGLFRKADPHFFAHLSRLAFSTQRCPSPAFTTRALAILDDLSKDDPVIPWLRQLTNHPDERVRSKAVKVLCRLRPSKSTVQLHLQSTDPRVRANAIEALWHTPSPDSMGIFKSVLNDLHHRVVANALVGLYYRKDPDALKTIINLTDHPSPKFRVAIVWALGHLADRRGIPALQKLVTDPAETVREKAQRVLGTFGPEPAGNAGGNPDFGQPLMTNLQSPGTLLPQVA